MATGSSSVVDMAATGACIAGMVSASACIAGMVAASACIANGVATGMVAVGACRVGMACGGSNIADPADASAVCMAADMPTGGSTIVDESGESKELCNFCCCSHRHLCYEMCDPCACWWADGAENYLSWGVNGEER